MKIACAHTYSKPLAIADNIQNIERVLRVFERENVEYALFPELSVSGYLNSAELVADYIFHHHEVKKKMMELSYRYSFAFAVGMPIQKDDQWYIAQVVYQQGEIIGMHFKTHLSVKEGDAFWESDELNLITIDGCQIGFQICLESHIPELSSIQEQKGAQILSIAFASPREKPEQKLERLSKMLQIRAYDNCVFVMGCNQTGITPSGRQYAGFSTIISPRGENIVSSSGYDQGYCIADINFSDIEERKESVMGYFPKAKRKDWLRKFS